MIQTRFLSCGGVGVDSDSYWNGEITKSASLIAAGSVTDAAVNVMNEPGKSSCICLVRPPGHHAERDLALGYCFFNSVAVSIMEQKRLKPDIKVCVFDWDIHHPNGTQNIFYG